MSAVNNMAGEYPQSTPGNSSSFHHFADVSVSAINQSVSFIVITTSLPRSGPSPATSSRPSRTSLPSTTAVCDHLSSKAFTGFLPILSSSMRKTRILNHSNRQRKVGHAAIITISHYKRVQEHAYTSKGSRSTQSANCERDRRIVTG